MGLKDINQNLYRPDSGIEKRGHEQSEFDPAYAKSVSGENFLEKKNKWATQEKGLNSAQRRIVWIGLIAVSIIAIFSIVAVLVYKYKNSAFTEDKVLIEIDGPKSADSNQMLKYKIRYKNLNRVELKNAEIYLNYSENFQPEGNNAKFEAINSSNGKISIGNIKSKEENEVEFSGKIYAPEETNVYLNAKLSYYPSNFNSNFSIEKKINILVKSSPIILEVSAPTEAASGNDIEYVIDFKNRSTKRFSDLRLKVEYASGFTFQSASPSPSEGNNFWYIGSLEENQSGKVKIQGNLEGLRNEAKSIKVIMGAIDNTSGKFLSFSEREKRTKIATSPFYIMQRVNGLRDLSVNTGDNLNYVVEFKNEGNIGLSKSIIEVEIKSKALDFPKIEIADGGYYDGALNKIIWKAVDIPRLANLQPGQTGLVKFSIPILEEVPVSNSQDKNFAIVSIATIDSPDVPTPIGSNKIISSNRIELKLNSDVILETKGFYTDSSISNIGPIMPTVGQETTYTIHWLVSNKYNNVSGVRVESSLPTGVKWTGKTLPESEKLTFNERTNSLVWDIGNLTNAIGILEPKREVIFQISITPQSYQFDKEIPLVNKSIITVQDQFTSKELKSESLEKTIRLPEDVSIPQKGYRVQAQQP